FTPSKAGDWQITFDPGGRQLPLEARVKVRGAAEELRYPNVNRPALEQLAVLSGGRVVELTDLAKMPQWLPAEPDHSAIYREELIWDNGLTLLLLVLLYSLDVGLRRRAGLA